MYPVVLAIALVIIGILIWRTILKPKEKRGEGTKFTMESDSFQDKLEREGPWIVDETGLLPFESMIKIRKIIDDATQARYCKTKKRLHEERLEDLQGGRDDDYRKKVNEARTTLMNTSADFVAKACTITLIPEPVFVNSN